MSQEEKFAHWADKVAQEVIDTYPESEVLTCASGITPSGVIHIGNFREIVTTELVFRALQKRLANSKQKARFIYSWDDYDVFRKVPKGMPNQEMLIKHLRLPIVDIPDPYGEEESYARHHEVQLEKVMPVLGIHPEYLYQAKNYRACTYADGMKTALEKSAEIKVELDKYRKDPLPDSFVPIRIFCEKCNKDTVEHIEYKGDYSVFYKCDCGFEDTFDLRKKGIAKLQWRVDWPMRWKHESVRFEPSGKDHSSDGGSFDTGKLIAKNVYDYDAPVHYMYDFVGMKGRGGKISSSAGGALTISDVLEVYEPEIVRYLFASSRLASEFSISFDLDVIKIYEDFDKCERVYYGTQEAQEKEVDKQKRIYELSAIDSENISKETPVIIGFRHMSTLVQVFEHDLEKVLGYLKEHEGVTSDESLRRNQTRSLCASNWLKEFAPDDMKFTVRESASDVSVPDELRATVEKFISLLQEGTDADEIGTAIYNYCKEHEIKIKQFFTQCYMILIERTKGPKLTQFIMTIGKEKGIKLLQEALS
ncbi:MAG: lysyl-tRNA synthetase class 1 [Candidatus Woesearchaeota archaeon]|jgi:lysyl-tRNA synthetase class 1